MRKVYVKQTRLLFEVDKINVKLARWMYNYQDEPSITQQTHIVLKEDITDRDVYFPPARQQGEEDTLLLHYV